MNDKTIRIVSTGVVILGLVIVALGFKEQKALETPVQQHQQPTTEVIVTHDEPEAVVTQTGSVKVVRNDVEVRVTRHGYTYTITAEKLCYHGLLPAEACR